MQQKLGKWSLRFTEAPFILESSSVVGTKEADGPLGGLFDIVGKDDRFGQNTWEKAESSMQRDALTMALGKHIWMHPTWTMYLQEICSDSLWPQPLVWKIPYSVVWSVWSMLHMRGVALTCSGICGSRVCKACGGSDIEPLWQCRKAVSLS